MRILVVDMDATQLGKTAATLRGLSHEVETTKSAREARERIMANAPHVVMVDLSVAIADGATFIRHVRSLTQRYVFVVVVSKSATDEQLLLAYDAGCDGDMHATLAPHALSARLKAAERLLHVEAKAPKKTDAETAAQLHAVVTQVVETGTLNTQDIVKSEGWRSMSAELQAMSATFLSVPITVETAEAETMEPAVASSILLTNVEHELEVRVALGADTKSAHALTSQLFGEHSPQLEVDMLGELANMAMGVMKTAFAQGSIAFTGGLPEAMPPERFRQFRDMCQLETVFALAAPDGSHLYVRAGVSSKKNMVVTPTSLREGMVLAKDVFNTAGMLLLRAGTRLSSTTADRLRVSLGPKQCVEVASVAA